MEERRNFQWFVQELKKRRLKIPFLNTILCAGDYTREKYTSEVVGNAKQVQMEPMKIKHALNSLIDEKSPMLVEFEPNRAICLIYRKSEVSSLTINHILSLSALRVSSMKIKSIHCLPPNCRQLSVTRVKASYQKQNLKFSCQKILGNSRQEPCSDVVKQKAKEITSVLNDYLQKASSNVIRGIVFDFLMDHNDNCFLLKVLKVVMSRLNNEINFQKLKHSASMRFTSTNTNADFVEILKKTVEKERSILPPILKHPLDMSTMNILNMEDLLEGMEFARPKNWARDLLLKNRVTRKMMKSVRNNIQDLHCHLLPWLRPFDPSQSAITYRQQAESRRLRAN